MKNLPDLGILFVVTLVFILIYLLTQTLLERLGVKDPTIYIMIYALISACALLYIPRGED